jgi:putative transposase
VSERSSKLSENAFVNGVLDRFLADGIETFDQIPEHVGPLDDDVRERFERLRDGLEAVFAKKSDAEVFAVAKLSHRQLKRLFHNVLEEQGSAGGVRGLSALVHRKQKERVDVEAELRPARTSVLELVFPHLRDLSLWPAYDSSGLVGEERSRFAALVVATETLFLGGTREQVEKKSGVTWGQYKRLLKRAIELKPGTREIRGFEAFAGWKAQNKRTRTAPDRPGSSAAGLFGKLLREYPIAEELSKWLKGQKRPNRVTPKSLRSQFWSIVDSEKGTVKVPAGEYPHNRDWAVRRPLSKWYEQVYLPRNSRGHVRTEMGEAASKVFDYTDGDGQTLLHPQPYDTWQIDEYTADVFLRFLMPSIFGSWDEIDLPRLAIIVVRECALGAVLAWRLVLAKQASAADISLVLRDAVMGQAKQRKVVAGSDYKEGSGYPAVLFELLRWKAPKLILIDNALSHLADAVNNIVLRVYNGKVDLGQAATPKVRAAVESEVMAVAMSLVQQLPFSSGRDPKDPVRTASKRPTGKVDVPQLLHTLDCYFANRNGVRRSAPGQISVIERLSRVIDSNQLGSVIPILAHKRKPHFFSMPVEREVKYSLDAKKPRNPHINYDSIRYFNSKILNKHSVKGLWLRIYPNYDNLQTVEAFRLDGSYVGTLIAEGIWGKFPHDSRVRKLYLHYKSLGELEEGAADSPLRALFILLSKKADYDKAAAAGLAHVVYYFERTLDPTRLRQYQAEAITDRINGGAANDDVHIAASELADLEAEDLEEPDPSHTDQPPPLTVVPRTTPATNPPGGIEQRGRADVDQASMRHAQNPRSAPGPAVSDEGDEFDLDEQVMFRVPKSI